MKMFLVLMCLMTQAFAESTLTFSPDGKEAQLVLEEALDGKLDALYEGFKLKSFSLSDRFKYECEKNGSVQCTFKMVAGDNTQGIKTLIMTVKDKKVAMLGATGANTKSLFDAIGGIQGNFEFDDVRLRLNINERGESIVIFTAK